jgi:hypothetical protein
MDNDVTDLPDPDSPTMPTVSFLFREKLMLLTALKMPSSDLNETLRFFTSSSDDMFKQR